MRADLIAQSQCALIRELGSLIVPQSAEHRPRNVETPRLAHDIAHLVRQGARSLEPPQGLAHAALLEECLADPVGRAPFLEKLGGIGMESCGL